MLTKKQKSMLRAAYDDDVWHGDDHMTDFCTKEVCAIAELPNGDFIPVDRQSLKTSFCFGESGYDYEEARDAAIHAGNSEDYFRHENMKGFDEKIAAIAEQYSMHNSDHNLPDWILLICEKPYNTQPENSPLKDVTFWRWSDILNAFGGSCRVEGLPGTRFRTRGLPYRVPTLAELDAIKAAYEEARDEHEKKVDRYLKRYGLSKVRTWTYWRDA